MSRTPHIVLWVALLLFPHAAYAQGEQWQIGTAPGFSSGRYGTDTRTEVFHMPVTARRLFEAGDLAFVVPLTCIRGGGDVTIVNGVPVRRERLDGDAASPTRTRSDAPGTTQPATECGLGDVVVRGRYYAIDERGWAPTVALRAHVKAPTASAESGLGTGRPDVGAGIEVSRTVIGGLLAMIDGGYTVIGDPAGVDYGNNWWYDVGVGQSLAADRLNISVFLEEYRALLTGLEDAREVLAAVTVRGAAGWRVQISGAVGLSDGAPDHGFTFGASRRF